MWGGYISLFPKRLYIGGTYSHEMGNPHIEGLSYVPQDPDSPFEGGIRVDLDMGCRNSVLFVDERAHGVTLLYNSKAAPAANDPYMAAARVYDYRDGQTGVKIKKRFFEFDLIEGIEYIIEQLV